MLTLWLPAIVLYCENRGGLGHRFRQLRNFLGHGQSAAKTAVQWADFVLVQTSPAGIFSRKGAGDAKKAKKNLGEICVIA